MSKIEDALEKANKLRESSAFSEGRELDAFKGIETEEINNHCLVTITQPDSQIAEEYRRLKSMLIRDTKSDFLNTLMITSAVDSEGKTLTVINLAVTFAKDIDHSILLIDADLRKPKVHEYLGIKNGYGLSDYLTRDIDISEVLVKTGIGNMILLPAGRAVENPAELLSSEKMKSLIHEVKHKYMNRYIIVDTPPILPFTDAISIGSLVDGIVFVVREGRTQKKTIENALNLIKNLNVLGFVFNNVRKVNLDGHYSHNYYYGYNRYSYKRENGE
jgi:exopolysaccharide/PEP-CTERM locus tyrosine autokinase